MSCVELALPEAMSGRSTLPLSGPCGVSCSGTVGPHPMLPGLYSAAENIRDCLVSTVFTKLMLGLTSVCLSVGRPQLGSNK